MKWSAASPVIQRMARPPDRAGPTFLGLFGKERKFAAGEPEVADEAYIKESILKPQAKIVNGFQKSEVLMPSYEGVLTEAQIQSLILFIKTHRPRPRRNSIHRTVSSFWKEPRSWVVY